MLILKTIQRQFMHHILLPAFVATLGLTALVTLPQAAYASDTTPPPVPANIQVPAGNELFLVTHAEGTQNYICLPSESGVAYTLFTPQAVLFDEKDKHKQIATHFVSPNPAENGTIRAAWQDSEDTSTIWAKVEPGNSSTDPNFVEPGAIAWLLLTRAGAEDGPTGGSTLSATTFIQRLNTSGGVAPSTGCASTTDIGNRAFVPYTTDYYFYRSAED